MKKNCSFFVLIFALSILLLPSKAKALSSDLNITVHNTSWGTIYSCTNCTGFGNNGVYANVYPYRSMLVYFPTYQAIQGNTYHLIFEYEMYVTDSFQPTDNLVFQIDGTAQSLNVIQFVKDYAEMPNGQFWVFKYEAEFKASVSGTTMRLEIAPNGQNNNYYSTLYEMNVSNWSLINYGIDSNTQAIVESQDKINDTLNEIEDTLTNDNIDGATNSATGFFNNFQANDHGLTSIVTAPLRFIQSMTNHSCTPLTFQLPFVHNEVSLPCVKSIVSQHFGVFLTLYQTITTGIIAYWVCVRILFMVKAIQDPQKDKISVFDL